MKDINLKLLVALMALSVFSGCSSHRSENHTTGVYDLQALQAYNAKIANGDTVSDEQKVTSQQVVEMPLNASDEDKSKNISSKSTTKAIPIVIPNVGLEYRRIYHYFR